MLPEKVEIITTTQSMVDEGCLQEMAARLSGWKADAARYRKVRRMNLRQFTELFVRSMLGVKSFDALVDEFDV